MGKSRDNRKSRDNVQARYRARRVYARLAAAYPDARCSLRYRTPFELLVATILSAQCTDRRVNAVCAGLFQRYRTMQDFAVVPPASLEREIRSTGFFRHKAAHIIASARMIAERFNGSVPQTMEELLQLPGVARKTANIVLYNAFGRNDGIAVDTHVRRISRRLGWSAATQPVLIEKELQQLFARQQWGMLSHVLIAHGRQECQARQPRCAACCVRQWCPSAELVRKRRNEEELA